MAPSKRKHPEPVLSLATKKLSGAMPFFVRPEARFVDQENDQVIFYWSENACESKPFQVSICDLKTGTWRNLTNRFTRIQYSWFTLHTQVKEPLPVDIGAAETFCKLGGQRFLLLFGGERFEGGHHIRVATSHFYAINIDKYKWWEIPVPEDVKPRAYGHMVFIQNSLYIFGGKAAQQNTFSITEFDPVKNTWNWRVQDRAYPPHVPPLGWAGSAVPVCNGRKVLLLPGVIDGHNANDFINFSASTIVLFDTTHYTFHVGNTMDGEFPSDMRGYDASLVSSSHFLSPTVKVDEDLAMGPVSTACSVLIAAWKDYVPDDDSVRPFPECGIWLINVSTDQPSRCFRLHTAHQGNPREPDLEKELRELDISFISCAALTDRRVLIFGSHAPTDEPYEELRFDTCVEIKV